MVHRVVHRPPPVDPTLGDNVDGEDLTIRRAAVDALGPVNGSVVVVDPTSGRILTMVNQKLAFTGGFIPCSTIKLVTSLAALTEHVVTRDTAVFISRRVSYNLTNAIAMSNNPYFGVLGTKLGFDRVIHYAQMLGLGEKAGLDVEGEQPGIIPTEPPKYGGMVLMTAYGEGFLTTPLELAALLSAIANGGTLYYLQCSALGRRDSGVRSQGKAHAGSVPGRHCGSERRDAQRGGLRHGPKGGLRSVGAGAGEDGDLHGFPRFQPHGLVRLV